MHRTEELLTALETRFVTARAGEAAQLLGIKQPDISKMLHGDFRQFSVERLLRFLIALGQDVEIVIKPHRDSRQGAQLRVA